VRHRAQRERERGLLDVVVSRESPPCRSECLEDGDREVGEPGILGFWRSKFGLRTTEEGLSLETAEAALGIAPEL
jgi:hypothetical protein